MRVKYYVSKLIISILLGGIISLFSCNPNDQETWKQFRGNNRNGASTEININEECPDEGPTLIWKTSIGSSFSEILVSKNRIFTMTSDTLTKSEYMVAYDEKNGKEIWRTIVDSMFFDSDGWGDGPRSTPAMDDKTVYCLSSFGKLKALSTKNGKILWTVNIKKEYDCGNFKWIYTTSPMLFDDLVILEVGGKESKGFAAFNKKTGKNLWVKGLGKPSYCSPTIATINDKKQVVFANDTMLLSFDKDGNELWSYRMPISGPIAMPLFIATNKFFVSSMRGSFLTKVENNEVTELYDKTSLKNFFSTSCYYNDYIYGLTNKALKCISASNGELKWSEKGFGSGSLILVGNKLLVLSDNGVLKLVEASPEAYTEKGAIQAIDGKSWTAPSYANGKVYVRNLTEMASFKIN